MVRLRSDLSELMQKTVSGTLADHRVEWDSRPSVCVVMAAEGYPGSYEKGKPIQGLEDLRDWHCGVVFHAGTARRDGQIVTNGGRVLGVTALGDTVSETVAGGYREVGKIRWEGLHYRHDIGWRAEEPGK